MRVPPCTIISMCYMTTMTISIMDAAQTTINSTTSSSWSERPAPNNTVHFVNIIKQHLRNNNDDYAEVIPLNVSNPYLDTTGRPTPPEHQVHAEEPTTAKETNQFYYKKERSNSRSNHYDKRRRAFDGVAQNSEEEANVTISLTVMASPATESGNPSIKASSQPRGWPTTAPPLKYKSFTSDKFPKYVNKNKMGKLKNFLDRNKGLLKEFISNKQMQMETQTVSMRAGKSAEDISLRIKPRFSEETPDGLVLPNSEQLDMAPAKGGRINIMRVKGQLCGRNVMVPEGPKYDSKGVSYLPAYKSARALVREYPRTRAPSLVLPRCCNCCKKSVLGCE